MASFLQEQPPETTDPELAEYLARMMALINIAVGQNSQLEKLSVLPNKASVGKVYFFTQTIGATIPNEGLYIYTSTGYKQLLDYQGSGSGLDADTIDTLNSTQFLRSDTADTGTGKITLTGGLDLAGGINGSLTLENGYHAINTNDGGGNFNIRVANDFSTGCTEAGWASHWTFLQSAGTWTFSTSTTTLAVDDTPSWSNKLVIAPTEMYHGNNLRPSTNGAVDLGTPTYRYRYANATYFNCNHGQTTRNTDTIFYSSTDSYMRKNTAAGYRTSLDVYSKGEVIDAGSNANGDYIKFADGTMIQRGLTAAVTTGTAYVASLYISAGTNQTFPVAFVGTASVSAERVDETVYNGWANCSAITTTTFNYRTFSGSATSTGKVSWMATGQWK